MLEKMFLISVMQRVCFFRSATRDTSIVVLGNWLTGSLIDKKKARNLDDSFIIIGQNIHIGRR